MKKRIYIKDLEKYIGQEVEIYARVKTRRDQGKMIFFDFKDSSGFVQGVVLPKSAAMEVAKNIREDFIVSVIGNVNERPEKNKNPDVQNGNIELEILEMSIINESEVVPFPIDTNTQEINENIRLEYRYLDLRSERMNKNIKNRFKVQQFIRNYLANQDFIEIETPLLSAPTPEGARSFIVPSRLESGKFYALPQSPQQYKQLLMVADFDRYFQFARCLRDEDSRGDRQPEFTQMDLEMSFVTEEDIIQLNEKMLVELIEKLYPEKQIQEIPFPRMTYKEVMEKYGTDRPDIRKDKNNNNLLAFLWVTDFPMFEKVSDDNNFDGAAQWTFTHNPFSRPKDEFIDDFVNAKNIENILSTQYDIVLNGFEIGGGSIRNHKPEMLKKTFEIMGYSEERIQDNFGHMLKALSFGAPPHGGIAWGFDRLLMILENEKSIREVIPFAKTGEGKDLMLGAPNKVSDEQLSELKLQY